MNTSSINYEALITQLEQKEVSTIKDVIDVYRSFHLDFNLSFHPDSDFMEYEYPDGERIFTEDQYIRLNKIRHAVNVKCAAIGFNYFYVAEEVYEEVSGK